MNVVIIGDICIDKNVSENVTYTSLGGAATFMNRIFDKYPDVNTTIVSHYGPDIMSLTSTLDLYPYQPDMSQSMRFENNSKGTIRQQKAYKYEASNKIKLDEVLKKLLQNADVLIFAPLLPHYTTDYIIRKIEAAKKEVIKFLLPQGYFREIHADHTVTPREFIEADTIIPLFDFIILSEEDHPKINTITKKWLKWTDIHIIITQGERGARYMSSMARYDVLTKAVAKKNVIDSAGAGDIFAAGFIYHYNHTKNIKKSLHYANKIAGWSLQYTPTQLETAQLPIA